MATAIRLFKGCPSDMGAPCYGKKSVGHIHVGYSPRLYAAAAIANPEGWNDIPNGLRIFLAFIKLRVLYVATPSGTASCT